MVFSHALDIHLDPPWLTTELARTVAGLRAELVRRAIMSGMPAGCNLIGTMSRADGGSQDTAVVHV